MPRVSQWSFRSWLLLLALVTSVPGWGQTRSPEFLETFKQEGRVVSATETTLLLESADGHYHLYVFDSHSTRPKALVAGTPVRISSFLSDDPRIQIADNVEILQAQPVTGGNAQALAPGNAAAVATTATNPVERRQAVRLQNEIERQTGIFQIGGRTGIGLNPEVIMIGVQTMLNQRWGPFTFRPAAEYLFGEITNMAALNMDVIFRLPFTARWARWGAYGGVGAALNFIDRSDGPDEGFNFSAGMNVLGGVRFRNGMFVEIKATPYSSPAPIFQIITGYNY